MHTLITAAKTYQMTNQTWLALAVMFVGACVSAIGASRQMRQRGKVGRYAISGFVIAAVGMLLLVSGK